MLQWSFFLSFVVVALGLQTTTAQATTCIDSLGKLMALQTTRGNKIAIPVTYVMCPNTVYLANDEEFLVLNGNATYLCGEDGSSANNCILRGGSQQLSVSFFAFDRAPKDNILVSGFTFEQAEFFTASIAMSGRSIIRDCIFRDNNNHGVFSFDFYIAPTLRRRRELASSPSNNSPSQSSWMSSISEEMEEMKRSLLIGGGSEPRVTTTFENCQFLNNSLTDNIEFPLIAQNGVVKINSAFSDVTMIDCLFKDNYFNFRFGVEPLTGYMVFVEASATLNIQNSCFIDNYYRGDAISVRAASGIAASIDNFSDDLQYSYCPFRFTYETNKCAAAESPSCLIPACAASYKVFNARTDRFFANIANGGTINKPPCSINIEAILPCTVKDAKVLVQLLRNGTVIQEYRDEQRFFLFGSTKNNILPGTIASGTYTIQTRINGIIQPAPFNFTLAGTCVP